MSSLPSSHRHIEPLDWALCQTLKIILLIIYPREILTPTESFKSHIFLKPKLQSLDATDESPLWAVLHTAACLGTSKPEACISLCCPHPHVCDDEKWLQILLSVLWVEVGGKPVPGWKPLVPSNILKWLSIWHSMGCALNCGPDVSNDAGWGWGWGTVIYGQWDVVPHLHFGPNACTYKSLYKMGTA